MKIIGFVFLALLGLSYALPPPLQDDDKLHIPDKCSDVLAVKVCDNLVEIAKRLKLKAEDVTKAVVDAVKKGKTSSLEIYNTAKELLMNEVLTKKCEDFTTQDNCDKLRKVAAFLKLNAAKVEEFVIKAVAEGAVQAKDIYAKAMEYYKNELSTKKCEDFLSVSQCSALRTIASKLKVKFDDLENAIKEKYLETLGDAKALYENVVAVLKDYALNTKCEDLLNADLCAALRKFAQTTKVQFPVLMEKAVDLLIKGYDVSKSLLNSIYKLVDHFYDCTDIFDQSSCDKLYKVASYLGVAHQKVEEFIKKYVPIAIEKGKDIISDFPNLIKELGKYIKDLWCQKTPFCYNSDDLNNEVMTFANDNGFFDFDLIKQKIKKYIENKFPGLQDKVKQRISGLVNKVKSIRELLHVAFLDIVMASGGSASTIRLILSDLIKNIKFIIYSPSTQISFDIDSKISIDLQVLKKKLKTYLENKYPGVQDEIKKQLTEAIDNAKDQVDIAVQFVKAMWNTAKDKVTEYIKIAKDLIAKAKDLDLTN